MNASRETVHTLSLWQIDYFRFPLPQDNGATYAYRGLCVPSQYLTRPVTFGRGGKGVARSRSVRDRLVFIGQANDNVQSFRPTSTSATLSPTELLIQAVQKVTGPITTNEKAHR